MTGINIKIRYGGGPTILRTRKTTVTGGVGEVDETDGESGGYGECDESGVAQVDVTFEGWYRTADGAPIKEGDLLTNVLVAWDGNVAVPVVNKRHLFPKLKILSMETSGGPREGSTQYIARCKSSGIYYPPGVS